MINNLIKICFLILFGFGCCDRSKYHAQYDIDFLEVDIYDFRSLVSFEDIRAIVAVAGEFPHEGFYDTLFIVSKEDEPIKSLPQDLQGFSIVEKDLLRLLFEFEFEQDSFSTIFSASLIYVVEDDKVKGYYIPFGQREEGSFQGSLWKSEELFLLLLDIESKYGLNFGVD